MQASLCIRGPKIWRFQGKAASLQRRNKRWSKTATRSPLNSRGSERPTETNTGPNGMHAKSVPHTPPSFIRRGITPMSRRSAFCPFVVRLSVIVMPVCGQDQYHHFGIMNFIDKPMLLGDATAPLTWAAPSGSMSTLGIGIRRCVCGVPTAIERRRLWRLHAYACAGAQPHIFPKKSVTPTPNGRKPPIHRASSW